MDNEAEILIKKMMDRLNAESNKELAELIGLSAAAISRWKKYNYVDPIKKKCRELGIYNEIFGNETPSIKFQQSGNGGQQIDKLEGGFHITGKKEENQSTINIDADDDIKNLINSLLALAQGLQKKEVLKSELIKLIVTLPTL